MRQEAFQPTVHKQGQVPRCRQLPKPAEYYGQAVNTAYLKLDITEVWG